MCAVMCHSNVAAKAGAALGEPEEQEENYVAGVATCRTVIDFFSNSSLNTNPHQFAP